jgi:hypothetical protein
MSRPRNDPLWKTQEAAQFLGIGDKTNHRELGQGRFQKLLDLFGSPKLPRSDRELTGD